MNQQFQHGKLKISRRVVGVSPPTDAAIATVAHRNQPAVLDSARSDSGFGRYTILACEPIAVFTAEPAGPDPFEAMRERLVRTQMLLTGEADALPDCFTGGWIGYFAYEAGRYIERLEANTVADIGLPIARFGLYDSAAIFDHAAGQWTVAATDFGSSITPGQKRSQADLNERLDWWESLLASAAAAPPEPADGSPSDDSRRTIVHNVSRIQFLRMVDRARTYIAAGDIFQVNLARRETIRAVEPPIRLYRRLRQTNPGAYAAFLSWPQSRDGIEDQVAILSSSPELFLQTAGRNIVTRPIKGTRPRSSDPAVDRALRAELAGSTKDRAELAMIVDLERNDLGRVCQYGSIRVAASDCIAAPYALESHPTVHHLVATVTGRLAKGRDAIDLLRASFPGGSITGAPKVRAMQIIDELEPTQRSVYTGCIGYFAPGGRMTMNIAIRTMIQTDGMLHWYAGGAIVADSDPAAEYDETVAKALGMRQAVSGENSHEL